MAEKEISKAIKQAEIELRQKYPFLNNQDLICGLIWGGSMLGIFSTWALYYHNSECYHTCAAVILLVALFTSFLHELEHDLIHNLYFKRSSWVQDIMFYGIWFSKLHGNPWFRRDLHLKHHIISGQLDDAEERLIGLGLPFGLERLAVTCHPFGSLIITPAVAKDSKWLDVQRLNLTSAPVAFLFFGLNKLWMLYVGVMLYVGYENYHLYLPAQHWGWVRATAVCMCLPNMLRQICLVMMSNCSHYYGDIPEKSVLYQNQILDHPIVWPMQMLCMNFGATHIVHHYVPQQPFYIREMCYRKVKSFMIEKGVRINDFGVVFRANRYFSDSPITSATVSNESTTRTAGAFTVNHTDEPEDPANPIPAATGSAGLNKIDKNSFDPTGRKVAPNGSGTLQMLAWIAVCFTVGAASYVIFDQWVSISLGRRILRKYIVKVKNE